MACWNFFISKNTNSEYRAAFVEYIRRGTPIRLSTKQEHPTTHYVWRTLKDEKVRSSHQANDGHVFAWNEPPETGHPEDEFNCRCSAEPYLATLEEEFQISLTGVADEGQPWTWVEFVDHYFNANGQAVTVRETGNLGSVVEYYSNTLGILDKLRSQIVAEARAHVNMEFMYDFGTTYDLTSVVFSIGDTTIGGVFSRFCSRRIGFLELQGQIEFYLDDKFVDPLDIGPITDPIDDGIDYLGRESTQYSRQIVEDAIADYLQSLKSTQVHLGRKWISDIGIPYKITDTWSASVFGRFHVDHDSSIY